MNKVINSNLLTIPQYNISQIISNQKQSNENKKIHQEAKNNQNLQNCRVEVLQESRKNYEMKRNIKNIPSKFSKQILQYITRKKIKRIKLHKCFYIFSLLSTLLLGTENLYLFLWDYKYRGIGIYFPSIILRIFFFLISSRLICDNWKVIAKLYFSFDKVFLTIVAQTIAIASFCKWLIPYSDFGWFYQLLYFLYPLLIFTFAGYFRILLVYARWSVCEIIFIKIVLLIGGSSYIGLGIYFSLFNTQFTGGSQPELDSMIKNLLLLYAFAGFDYHLQIFSIMDEIDGSSHFKDIYHLECDQQSMEILLHGHKVTSSSTLMKMNKTGISNIKMKKVQSIILE